MAGGRVSVSLRPGLPKVHARPTLSSTPRQEPPAGHLARFFGKARFLPKVFLQYGFEGASTQAAFRTSRDVRLSPDTAQRMPSSAIVSSATSTTCRLSSVSTVDFQPPCANQQAEMSCDRDGGDRKRPPQPRSLQGRVFGENIGQRKLQHELRDQRDHHRRQHVAGGAEGGHDAKLHADTAPRQAHDPDELRTLGDDVRRARHEEGHQRRRKNVGRLTPRPREWQSWSRRPARSRAPRAAGCPRPCSG